MPSEVASSSSSITDIGTTALIWRSPPIDSARVISQARSAPVTVARMTSLTVPPWTWRTLRYAARSVRTATNRRCCDSGPWIGESVAGRRLDSALATAPTRVATASAERSTDPVFVRTVSRTVPGLVSESRTASTTRPDGVDGRAGRHSSLPRVRGSTLTSSRTWPMSTVSTPSTSAWCDFDSTATRPSARPSTK